MKFPYQTVSMLVNSSETQEVAQEGPDTPGGFESKQGTPVVLGCDGE